MEFAFRVADERSAEVPGICTVYVSGVLAMRTDVKEALFCDACDGLEFLPITVDGEQWLLLNCLNAVTRFDESKSNVMRGLTGEIFMVLKLSVVDPMAQHCELFTLSHSNRMELFALPSFKRRVEKLHLKGITFRRVGEIA